MPKPAEDEAPRRAIRVRCVQTEYEFIRDERSYEVKVDSLSKEQATRLLTFLEHVDEVDVMPERQRGGAWGWHVRGEPSPPQTPVARGRQYYRVELVSLDEAQVESLVKFLEGWKA